MALKGYIKHNNAMLPVCDNDSLSVGMIIPFAGNGNVPVGWLLCNGASVNKNTYPALFAAIGYAYGGSGNYFNLPNLTDKFIEGGIVAGIVKEAGLPNIEGEFAVQANYALSGAFQNNGSYSSNNDGTYSKNNTKIKFNASNSNDIYGNSNTVQPPALTMRYIIKAFAGASNDSTDVAITNIANELNAFKIDTDYIVDSGKSTDGTIWYRKWKSGWLEQGGYLNVTGNLNTVTFIKPYQNEAYQLTIGYSATADETAYKRYMGWYTKTRTSFTAYSNHGRKDWYACGMGVNE